MLTIEKGIPCPAIAYKKMDEDIGETLWIMKVGDSFVIPAAYYKDVERKARLLNVNIHMEINESDDTAMRIITSYRVWKL